MNKWTGEAFLRSGKEWRTLYHLAKAAFLEPYRLKDPFSRKTVISCLPFRNNSGLNVNKG
jgi:hypothetical protein